MRSARMHADHRGFLSFRALLSVTAWTAISAGCSIVFAERRCCYGLGMTKAELHELVDALPEESLPAAAILLRRAQDPVIAKLDAAPYDDEELNEEDQRAIREARREPGVPWPDVQAELKAG